MSTSCNINVKTKQGTICLYHYYDGYPEGVGFDLVEMVERVSANKFALTDDFLNALLNDSSYEFSTCGLHGDIEYLYTVNFEKRSIKCQPVSTLNEHTFGKPFDVIKMYNKEKAGEEK